MNMKVATIVSAVSGLCLACILGVVSSGGRYYFAEVDWQRVESMPYSQAQEYLTSRSAEISRLESLNNAISYPVFWYGLLLDVLMYMALGLVCCWFYQKYAKPDKVFERSS